MKDKALRNPSIKEIPVLVLFGFVTVSKQKVSHEKNMAALTDKKERKTV